MLNGQGLVKTGCTTWSPRGLLITTRSMGRRMVSMLTTTLTAMLTHAPRIAAVPMPFGMARQAKRFQAMDAAIRVQANAMARI